MITLIVALSPEGVIGLHGKMPWHHPGDMRRFKQLTTGGTVVMGRLTYESIGKPLPNRRNVVIASKPIEGVETFNNLKTAMATTTGDVWIIGGARIYAEAMNFVDRLDVTFVPDHVEHPDAIRFPKIDLDIWDEGPLVAHEEEPTLMRREYVRHTGEED